MSNECTSGAESRACVDEMISLQVSAIESDNCNYRLS